MVNQAALTAFFGDAHSIVELPGDPEANPDNYAENTMVRWDPVMIPVHIGLRISFTQNVYKQMDYVNGMSGE
eukprot:8669144-Prorocentrum_lima.AAC.1